MKNLLLLMLAVISLAGYSQKGFIIGIGGGTGTDFQKKQLNKDAYRSNSFGINAEYRFNKYISIVSGLALKNNQQFHLTKGPNEFGAALPGGYNLQYSFNYLTIPMLAKYSYHGIYLNIGPGLNYIYQETYETKDGFKSGTIQIKGSHFTSDLITGIGYNFNIKKIIISPQARYIVPIVKYDNYGIDNTPSLFALNLTLAYNLTK